MGRYEYKYQLRKESYQRIKIILGQIMTHDSFADQGGRYRVDSLYFDTADFAFRRQKVEGEFQHIKLRLRSYGENPFTGSLYWEAKLKWNHWQKKLRSPVTITDGPYTSIDSCPLLVELRAKSSVHPQCVISYMREAFVAPGLRLNFDHDLEVAKKFEDRAIAILPSCYCIFELKTVDQFLPNWLKKLIEVEGLAQINFSKYAVGLDVLESSIIGI